MNPVVPAAHTPAFQALAPAMQSPATAAQQPVQAATGDSGGEDSGMPDAPVPEIGNAPMEAATSQGVQSSGKDTSKRKREQGKFTELAVCHARNITADLCNSITAVTSSRHVFAQCALPCLCVKAYM